MILIQLHAMDASVGKRFIPQWLMYKNAYLIFAGAFPCICLFVVFFVMWFSVSIVEFRQIMEQINNPHPNYYDLKTIKFPLPQDMKEALYAQYQNYTLEDEMDISQKTTLQLTETKSINPEMQEKIFNEVNNAKTKLFIYVMMHHFVGEIKDVKFLLPFFLGALVPSLICALLLFFIRRRYLQKKTFKAIKSFVICFWLVLGIYFLILVGCFWLWTLL